MMKWKSNFSKKIFMLESAMLKGNMVSLGIKELTTIEIVLNSIIFKSNLSFTRIILDT